MRIGIDLGGTKTEIICLHPSNGKELYRKRVATPNGDYDATIMTMARLVLEAETEVNQKGTIGVGIPGVIARDTGLVKNANSVWLNGHPLDRDLSAALQNRPIRAENDANCLAVSEATDGAGTGRGVVFAVIVGTGCGAGICVNGQPVSGLNGLGGEWGHNPLSFPRVYHSDPHPAFHFFDGDSDPEERVVLSYSGKARPDYFTGNLAEVEYPGPQCYCGKRGCLERWISGTAFREDFVRVTGRNLSTHDIVALAGKGDAEALAALSRYCDRFARAIAGVIDILDPDIIVVGGGMSNVATLYTEVPKIWDKYIFSNTPALTPLVPARFGDSSGVRGAAWLWGKE